MVYINIDVNFYININVVMLRERTLQFKQINFPTYEAYYDLTSYLSSLPPAILVYNLKSSNNVM